MEIAEDTQITTVARRIARTANTHRAGWRLYFSAAGELLEKIYGPTAFGPNSDQYHLMLYTVQHHSPRCDVHHWTYAEIQALLDEITEARTPEGISADKLMYADWAAEWEADYQREEDADWAAQWQREEDAREGAAARLREEGAE